MISRWRNLRMIGVPTAIPSGADRAWPGCRPHRPTRHAAWRDGAIDDRIRTSDMRRAGSLRRLAGRLHARRTRRRRRPATPRPARRAAAPAAASRAPICRASRCRARQEDLEVSVGDRVLFDYDSSVLDPVATQTLDRQAAWLKQYPDVIVTDRRPRRRARHARVQPGARRPPRQRGQELPGRARRQRRSPAHDLLRRGAARPTPATTRPPGRRTGAP